MSFDKIKKSAKKLGKVYGFIHKGYTSWLHLNQKIHRYKHRERRVSYGSENPEITFYVIGVNHTSAGLFAIVKSVFCHILYAVNHGYVPVVDMQNFKSQLSCGDPSINSWELFFEQPSGYTLDDIKHSKNIIKSATLPYPKGVEIGFDTEIDQAFYDKYHEAFQLYIKPAPKVKDYLQLKLESVGLKGKVLGMLCRGTDYIENHPSGHPIQPSIEQALQKAGAAMLGSDYDHLFLATEDKKYHDAFAAEFKEKFLFNRQKLYEGMNGKKYLSEIQAGDDAEKWHNIVDYYSTIFILSKCTGLIAGLTCGSICAYLMADNYKNVFFWNLGRYS